VQPVISYIVVLTAAEGEWGDWWFLGQSWGVAFSEPYNFLLRSIHQSVIS